MMKELMILGNNNLQHWRQIDSKNLDNSALIDWNDFLKKKRIEIPDKKCTYI